MATLAALKAYFTRVLGDPVEHIAQAGDGRFCRLCGRQGAEFRVTRRCTTPATVSLLVDDFCGDFAACEKRKKEKEAALSKRALKFAQYVAGLEIPEESDES